MKVGQMRVNAMTAPVGIAPEHVTLAYGVEEAEGSFLTASRVELTDAAGQSLLDTGWVDCAYDDATGKMIAGMDNLAWEVPQRLPACSKVLWRVSARTDAGEETVSEWSSFETAKASGEAWQASWITTPFGRSKHPVFYGKLDVKKELKSAQMYCLGLGVYEAFLNGEKLGDEVLLPGLQTFDRHLQYQMFVLDAKQGENELCFQLGEGWYMGRYGLKVSAPRYGTEYALIAEIHLAYADGTEEIVGTDDTWQVCAGPIEMDSIYDGEVYDANKPMKGELQAAVLMAAPDIPLIPRLSPPIRIQEHRQARLVSENILDFGQNMTGWAAFRCTASKGTKIHLRYGELVRDGQLYQGNLRTAKCEYTYISDGQERWVHPHFTFYGFRYVEVTGMEQPLQVDDFDGCVVYSQMEQTGTLETDHAGLNQLMSNQWWSQKDNFLDVPTDCPQRDERMGWTGDIGLFASTALFNGSCAAFLKKFLHGLWDDQQTLGGAVPCVSPMAGYKLPGVAAWGDAATIVPWQVYLHTGDQRVLADQLESMKAWVDYISRETAREHTGHIWNKTPQLGDWLALDGNSVYGGTDRGLIATAYYYLSADITAKAAEVLGDEETFRTYGDLAASIRNAFQAMYVTSTGRLTEKTQTAYALCLCLGLIPEQGVAAARKELRRLVIEAGSALTTGFVGTNYLLDALTDAGDTELAYTLLLRQDYPSWLYEVGMGATTIWERWNSIEPDGSMNSDGMNSLNHYAYGAVASWMYRVMGGINVAEEAPGWRKIMIAPKPDRRIGRCKVEKQTEHGLLASSWYWDGNTLCLDVTVPFGCKAALTLPETGERLTLTKGSYHYEVEAALPTMPGLEQPWRETLGNPVTRQVVADLFPRAIRGVAFQYEMYTMEQLTQSPFAELTAEETMRLEEALKEAQLAVYLEQKKEIEA